MTVELIDNERVVQQDGEYRFCAREESLDGSGVRKEQVELV